MRCQSVYSGLLIQSSHACSLHGSVCPWGIMKLISIRIFIPSSLRGLMALRVSNYPPFILKKTKRGSQEYRPISQAFPKLSIPLNPPYPLRPGPRTDAQDKDTNKHVRLDRAEDLPVPHRNLDVALDWRRQESHRHAQQPSSHHSTVCRIPPAPIHKEARREQDGLGGGEGVKKLRAAG